MRRVGSALGAFWLGVTACGGLSSPGRAGVEARGRAHGGADAGARDAHADASGAEGPTSYVTVPLSSCVPALYTASVTIGGTQKFQLAIDTGSTTLAVAAAACSSCSGIEPVYTPGSGAMDEHQGASSQYETGDWSGQIYQDLVSVGTGAAAKTEPPTAVPMPIVAIDKQSDFFVAGAACDSTPIDGFQGILGLGPQGAAVQGTVGYLDALVTHGTVPDLFAIHLCDRDGTLWLGGYDAAAMTAPPAYTPEVSTLDSLYYAVDLEAVEVRGQRVPVSTQGYGNTAVDAGSSVFILNTTAFDQVTAAIAGDPGFTAAFGDVGQDWFKNTDCSIVSASKSDLDAKLPPLTLELGTSPAVLVEVPPTESYLVPYQGGWCAALDVIDPGFDFPFSAVLGTPVLRSSVVVFDRANKRIGFAPHAPCP